VIKVRLVALVLSAIDAVGVDATRPDRGPATEQAQQQAEEFQRLQVHETNLKAATASW